MRDDATIDETRLFLCLALEHIEEAAAIITGRSYGYGVVGVDLERVGQAMKELLQALNDSRWVLANLSRWKALQGERPSQDAESDIAFRAFLRTLSL